MKIDESVIKKVMLSMDESAKNDKEFLESIDLFIYQLKKNQKKENAKRKAKSK